MGGLGWMEGGEEEKKRRERRERFLILHGESSEMTISFIPRRGMGSHFFISISLFPIPQRMRLIW